MKHQYPPNDANIAYECTPWNFLTELTLIVCNMRPLHISVGFLTFWCCNVFRCEVDNGTFTAEADTIRAVGILNAIDMFPDKSCKNPPFARHELDNVFHLCISLRDASVSGYAITRIASHTSR